MSIEMFSIPAMETTEVENDAMDYQIDDLEEARQTALYEDEDYGKELVNKNETITSEKRLERERDRADQERNRTIGSRAFNVMNDLFGKH